MAWHLEPFSDRPAAAESPSTLASLHRLALRTAEARTALPGPDPDAASHLLRLHPPLAVWRCCCSSRCRSSRSWCSRCSSNMRRCWPRWKTAIPSAAPRRPRSIPRRWRQLEAGTAARASSPGFRNYLNRNHLAVDEICGDPRQQQRLGRRGARIYEPALLPGAGLHADLLLRRDAAGDGPGLCHCAGGQHPAASCCKGPAIFVSLLPMIITPLVGSLILSWMINPAGHHRRDAAGPVQTTRRCRCAPRRC